jgi:hypothetical protein
MESVLSAACRKPTKGSLRVEYSPQLRLTAPCQPTGVPCWVRNCMQYARHYLSATVLYESLGNSVRRQQPCYYNFGQTTVGIHSGNDGWRRINHNK